MSRTRKIYLSLILFVVALCASLVGYVSTKIRPGEIEKVLVRSIEGALPGTKTTIKKIDFSLGLKTSFLIEEIKITDRDNNELLFGKEINVKVPIWAIITGGGSIDISLDQPLVNLALYKDGSNNWFKTINRDHKTYSEDKVSKTQSKKVESKVEIPNFVKNSKINISIIDSKIFIDDNLNKTQVILDKILLKNLNLNKATAYEVVSAFKYQVDSERSISLSAHLVGELDISDYLQHSKLSVSSLLSLKNITLDGFGNVKIPNVKNVFKLEYDKNVSTKINNHLEVGNVVSSNFSLVLNKTFDTLALNSIDMSVDLSTLDSIVKLPYKISEGQISILGDCHLLLENMAVTPNLTVLSSKDLVVDIFNNSIRASIKGKVNKEKIDFEVAKTFADAHFNTKLTWNANPFNLPEKVGNYAPISVDIIGDGVELSRKYLSSLLYANPVAKQDKQVTQTKEEANKVVSSDFNLPPINVSIFVNRLKLESSILELKSSLKVKSNKIQSNFKLLAQDGMMEGDIETILSGSSVKNIIDLKVRNFDFINVTALLPPFLSQLKGMSSGFVKGHVNLKETLAYNLDTHLSVVDGDVKGLNLESLMGSYTKNVSFISSKVDIKNLGDKFKKLDFRGVMKESHIEVGKILFEGNDNSFEFNLSGKVSMIDQPSELRGNVEIKNSKANPIPVLIKGNGFVLKPELKYTTDKLTERAFKSTVKKEKKSVEKKMKKVIEDKAQKFLKGLKL